MADRCEPPPEWRNHHWHWLRCNHHRVVSFYDESQGWHSPLGYMTPEEKAMGGYSWYAPARPDDADARVRLEAENARLREALDIARQGFLIVSGQSQCIDNLLGHEAIAMEALRLMEGPE